MLTCFFPTTKPPRRTQSYESITFEFHISGRDVGTWIKAALEARNSGCSSTAATGSTVKVIHVSKAIMHWQGNALMLFRSTSMNFCIGFDYIERFLYTS